MIWQLGWVRCCKYWGLCKELVVQRRDVDGHNLQMSYFSDPWRRPWFYFKEYGAVMFVNTGVQHISDTRVLEPCSRAPWTQPVDTAREHGQCAPSTRVHGPCWQKALSWNVFCQHGAWTRVLGTKYPWSRAIDTGSVGRPLAERMSDSIPGVYRARMTGLQVTSYRISYVTVNKINHTWVRLRILFGLKLVYGWTVNSSHWYSTHLSNNSECTSMH